MGNEATQGLDLSFVQIDAKKEGGSKVKQSDVLDISFLEKPAPVEPEPAEQVDMVKGSLNSVAQGATLGFADEIQSVIAATVASPFVSDKTFSQLMIDARNSLRDENNNFKEQNPKLSFGLEVAGGLAVPGGAAANSTKGGLKELAKQGVKIGTATGVTVGAGMSDSEDFFSLNTALDSAIGGAGGAVLGAALPLAINAASKGIKSALNRPELQIFNNTGQFTDEALSALDDLVKSGKASADDVDDLIRTNLEKEGVLSREQAQNFNLFVKRGVTPTRANVTQKTDDFRMQQDAVKRSGAVSETVARQDGQIIETVSQNIDNIRPRSTNLVETNSNVFNVVDDVVNTFDEAVTKAYQVAKTESQGQPLVGFDKLADAISNNRGKENVSGGIISAMKQTLKNKGLIKKGSDLNINKRSEKLTGEGLKKLTVKEAEEVRQELNSLFQGASPQGRILIRELKEALDDDVASAVGEDIFRDARLAKVRFHELIEKGSRNKFDKSRGGFLEDVINNKIPEEKILQRLLNGRDDDFVKMKRFLNEDAGLSGEQAWNDIKAQVLRNALEKGTSTMGKGENGQQVFNSRLFKNELNKLRNSKKFGELFNADEIEFIDDIINIGSLRVPPSSVSQGSGPSAFGVETATNEIIKRIPIIGDKAVDLTQALRNIKTDKRLLDVTRETRAAIQ